MKSNISISKELLEEVIHELSTEDGLYVTDNRESGEYWRLNHKELINELTDEKYSKLEEENKTGVLLVEAYQLITQLVYVLRMTGNMQDNNIYEEMHKLMEEIENDIQ